MPRDAIDTAPNISTNNNLNYAHGIVDEAMQWNRDREGSSLGSSSDNGNAPSAGESSNPSSRGLDPSTLYFKKEDVIMLVDGESMTLLCYFDQADKGSQTRLIQGDI